MRIKAYKQELPGLADNFYIPPDAQAQVRLDAGGSQNDNMRWLGNEKGGTSVRGWTSPGEPRFEEVLRPDRGELNAAHAAMQAAGPGVPVDARIPRIDWDRTADWYATSARRRNPDLEKALAGFSANWQSIENPPQFGPDLGGFARRYGTEPGPNQIKAYTVVPSANPGRFSQRILPALIDDVYGSAQPSMDLAQHAAGQFTSRQAGVIPGGPRGGGDKKVSAQNWQELAFDKKVQLLEQIAPGQTTGTPGNQSGVLWGTTYKEPRYGYAQSEWEMGPNPEVHVSFVNTPRELETDYSITHNTHSPYVRRYSEPEGSYRTGPHWGVAEDGPGTVGGLGNRPRRDVRGDVSWRGDLTESRGAFSVADAQAVQRHLGIPLTGGEGPRAMGDAVGAIREHLGLATDADVIDRFARRVPRLGRTTAPRQPATIVSGSIKVDDKPGIPSALKTAYDLPGALERAGVPPTHAGVVGLNARIDSEVGGALQRINRMAGAMPFIGAIGGLLDPDAAKLMAQSATERDPRKSRELLLQGFETFGRNTALGSVLGGTGQLGMKALAAQAPGLAARVLPTMAEGAAFAGPIGLGLSVYQTADAVTEGLTGRSLTARSGDAFRSSPAGQSLRTSVGGRNAQEIVPQLFPEPRSVAANTPTGVAQVGQTRAPRVGDRGARGRVYAGEGWGWQSAQSYERLKQEGRLPGSRPQQLINRGVKALSDVVSVPLTGQLRVGDRDRSGRVYAGQGWGWQAAGSYERLKREGRLPGSRPQQLLNRGVQSLTQTNWLGWPQQMLRRLTGG